MHLQFVKRGLQGDGFTGCKKKSQIGVQAPQASR